MAYPRQVEGLVFHWNFINRRKCSNFSCCCCWKLRQIWGTETTVSVKWRCRNIYITGPLRNLPQGACSSRKISCSSVQIPGYS